MGESLIAASVHVLILVCQFLLFVHITRCVITEDMITHAVSVIMKFGMRGMHNSKVKTW